MVKHFLLIRILFILRNDRNRFDKYKVIYYYLDAKLNCYYSKLVICVVPRMQHVFFIFSVQGRKIQSKIYNKGIFL